MPRGYDSFLKLKRQTALGTPVVFASTDLAFPFISEGLRAEPTIYGSEAIRKLAEAKKQLARAGTLDVGGSIEFEATNSLLHYLLPAAFPGVQIKSAVGDTPVVDTGGDTVGAKNRIYTQSTAATPYFSAEVNDGQVSRRYEDMQLGSLALAAEINQLARISTEWSGTKAVATDAGIVTAKVDPASEYGLYFDQAIVKMIGSGGVLAEITAKSFNLSVNRNLMTDRYRLGSRFRRDVPVGTIDVTGSVMLDANSLSSGADDLFNAAMASTFMALELKFTDGENLAAAGVSSTFTVSIPFALLNWPEHNVTSRDFIEGNVNFTSYNDGTNGLKIEHVYKI